ncbi:MAG: glycosyltransferase family 2 protein [Conexivisphaerales archaeon]
MSLKKDYSLSVIIPVYRTSPTLEDTILKLISSKHPSKEIIVVVDCPDQNIQDIVERYGKEVVFDVSHERRGKVSCLRRGCSLSKGDAFFFLDADTSLVGEDLLKRINEELQSYDVVEFKKVVKGNSLLSKMVYYEYLGISAADWLISVSTRRTFGMNGAAFAITKEAFEKVGGFRDVISEDLDFGLRCFERGLKFKFIDDLPVYTFAPPTFSAWVKQRKRWAYGTAKWLRDNWKEIFVMVRSKPQIALLSLLMIFPSLLALFASFAFRDLAIWDTIALLFISFPARSFPLLLIPFVTPQEINGIFSFATATLFGLAAYSSLYFYFARRMKLKFSPILFVLYYLVYSPLWLAAMVWGIVRVAIKEEVDIDWKV